MGNKHASKTKYRRRIGKVNTPLNKKLKNVEWGEKIYLKELFSIKRGKRLTVEYRVKGERPLVTAGFEKTGVAEYIGNENQETFPEDTITIDMFGNTFYRNYKYSADDNILVLFNKKEMPSKAKIFIVNLINRQLHNKFSYGKQFRIGGFEQTKIQLPIKNGKIDFDFMESFIADLETERIKKLEDYLVANGFNNYILTDKEKEVLEAFRNSETSRGGVIDNQLVTNLKWRKFNLEKLFGKATRGKRLKGDDRILGDLPFVTAGETDEGVSAFIGNNVNIFPENTTTIDMFGSAKYRNYKYGGDDHVAVVHTENLPKLASIFVTTSIHKTSYNGQFNYGRNFYAKDADELNISLPAVNNQPNYELMEILISAIQKLVLKDVVLYVNNKING